MASNANDLSLDEVAWHQLRADEAVQLLDVDLRRGLPASEVEARQVLFGRNVLTPPKRVSEWVRLLRQFNQPLLYILLAATVVTLALSQWVDASVIFGVVLINAVIGYIQEARAERAIEAVGRTIKTQTTVLRDGRRRSIDAAELVPGDVVLLQSGDRVPADLRLFNIRDLRIDEALLTGESVPVDKHVDAVAAQTVLAERKNLAYTGTLVTNGQGEGVVWATGDRTETGRIATLMAETVELSTPLMRRIARFSQWLMVVIIAMAAISFVAGLLRGEGPVEMFMAAVALAVGAIPEGLPAAVTITLAIGVSRMARRRAIIRKLPAVETLGSTTVICSDKTGTLTENQMTVQRIFAAGEMYEVTGSGYEPHGRILWDGSPQPIDPDSALGQTLIAGYVCNDAGVHYEDGRASIHGDPTEAALIVVAMKAGILDAEVVRPLRRIDVIPFESANQFMATLHEPRLKNDESRTIYKKGSVERVLESCSTMLDGDGREIALDVDFIRETASTLADDGLRVLAMARAQASPELTRLEVRHVSNGMTFLGLQGMIDAPRANAITAVGRCHSAGIAVKMITGDHPRTAAAIARQMNLGRRGESITVTGSELDAIDDESLIDLVHRADTFARVAPEQKLRLVRALQARGDIVAMTGDGVNDAPSLKQADIGIAMGITGTEVAKAAADMILTDDNFASVEAAVEEGRNVFDNLIKFILWTLPTNASEGAIILAAITLGTVLPVLPVQVLWINMTTAVMLGLMLVFEPKEAGLMSRPPRDPQAPILDWPMLMRTGLVSVIILIGAFVLFLWHRRMLGTGEAEARTIVANTVVVAEAFYLLNCRSLTRSMWSVGLFSNPWIFPGIAAMGAAQWLFTYTPVMNRLFHTAAIAPQDWLFIFAIGVLVYTAVGLEKVIRFHRFHRLKITA